MFDVIYADPPWEFQSGGARSGRFGKLDYPTMKTKAICDIPVHRIANDRCALFMWAVGSMIPDALQVGAAWGFKFVRVDKVWAKKTVNGERHAVVGPFGVNDAEFVLLFQKQSMCAGQTERNQFTVYYEEGQTEVVDCEYPGVHSGKPVLFRELIERRFDWAKRVDLFCRVAAPGWNVIGNAIDGRDITQAILEDFADPLFE